MTFKDARQACIHGTPRSEAVSSDVALLDDRKGKEKKGEGFLLENDDVDTCRQRKIDHTMLSGHHIRLCTTTSLLFSSWAL